jgi:hypothetical protein
MAEDRKKCVWLQPHLLPFDQAIKEAQTWISTYKESMEKKLALQALTLMEKKEGNFDPTNHLHVHEIFPMVWGAIRSLEERVTAEQANLTKAGFLEQLADIMARGSCVQGRTHRLLMYYCLIDSES